MTKLITIIIGTLVSFSAVGQEQIDSKIKELDGKMYYLLTKDSNIQLDSIDLQAINPNWVKGINVVKWAQDSVKDHNNSHSPSTTNVYIELKRKYLRKYLKVISRTN